MNNCKDCKWSRNFLELFGFYECHSPHLGFLFEDTDHPVVEYNPCPLERSSGKCGKEGKYWIATLRHNNCRDSQI